MLGIGCPGRHPYPAAAYVEMAVAVGKEFFGGDVVCEDVEFLRALVLADQPTSTLQLVFDQRPQPK
jgi:hypothetical protein